MERYNYLETMVNDIKENFSDYIALKSRIAFDREELEEALNDKFWTEDCITGNASGSYFCNAWKAEEAIAHNLDLLAEALAEFGSDGDVLKNGAEWCDVTIRCYLLNQAISEVLDELNV